MTVLYDAVRTQDDPGATATEDALDGKFSHIVDAVKLVLDVPAAHVALFDRPDTGYPAPRHDDATLAPILGALAAADGPFAIADVAADARFAMDLSGSALRGCLVVPFQRAGAPAGVLAALDERPRDFTAHEVAVLTHLARCVVSELDLYDRAMRDDLTGVMRRQPFMRALGAMMARHRHAGTPAVLSILDLDHFKRVNDEHGHMMGDCVLAVVADTARDVLGRDVLFARLGGEEFAIAFKSATLADALGPLSRLQTALSLLRFSEQPGLRITGSFGVSALHPAFASVPAWYKMADAALYGAKQAGRNQVRVGFASSADGAVICSGAPVPLGAWAPEARAAAR